MTYNQSEGVLYFRNMPVSWARDGLKIGSIRAPREGNDFTPGQVVRGVFDTDTIPLVILGAITAPISDLGSINSTDNLIMPGGLLLGDGFESRESAEETLINIYANTDTPIEAGQDMRGLLFTSVARIEQFREIDRYLLQHSAAQDLNGLLDFSDYGRDNTRFRQFFFDSWAFWALDFHKMTLPEFPYLLVSLGIISQEVEDHMYKTLTNMTNTRSKPEKARMLRDFREGY